MKIKDTFFRKGLNPFVLLFIIISFIALKGDERSVVYGFVALITFMIFAHIHAGVTFTTKYWLLMVAVIFSAAVTLISPESGKMTTQILKLVMILGFSLIGSAVAYRKGILVSGLKALDVLFTLVAGIYGLYESTIKFNIFAYDYCLKIGMINRYYWQFSPSSYRVATFFIHPIIYSVLVSFFILVSMYEFRGSARIFLVSLLLVNLFLTKSRTSWIAMALVLLLIILKKISRSGRIRIKTVFVGIFTFSLIPAFLLLLDRLGVIQTFQSRFANLSQDGSALQRTGTISYFLHTVFPHSNPIALMFGHGAGSASRLMSTVDITAQGFSETDNQFISAGYDYGLIILALIVVSFVYSFYRFWKADTTLRELIALSLVCLNISMFFFTLFEFLPTAFIYFVLLGFLLTDRNVEAIQTNILGSSKRESLWKNKLEKSKLRSGEFYE